MGTEQHNNCDHTVLAAAVGGINNVKPPSTQSRLRNIVAGLGARYPGIKEDVKTASIKSLLESN
jgi:hypothetical protein